MLVNVFVLARNCVRAENNERCDNFEVMVSLTCKCLCVYVCMYICMYIHTYIHLSVVDIIYLYGNRYHNVVMC